MQETIDSHEFQVDVVFKRVLVRFSFRLYSHSFAHSVEFRFDFCISQPSWRMGARPILLSFIPIIIIIIYVANAMLLFEATDDHDENTARTNLHSNDIEANYNRHFDAFRKKNMSKSIVAHSTYS